MVVQPAKHRQRFTPYAFNLKTKQPANNNGQREFTTSNIHGSL